MPLDEDTPPALLTLVVMRPVRTRDILLALLGGLPYVKLLRAADDAAQAARRLAYDKPSVVVLDWELRGDTAFSLLRHLKDEYPAVRCLALVPSYKAEAQARAALADAVLLRGFAANDLMGVLTYLWHNPQPLTRPG